VLPSSEFKQSAQASMSSTNHMRLNGMNFVKSPGADDSSGTLIKSVNLHSYRVGGKSGESKDFEIPISSVTAQAVVDNLNLGQCVEQVNLSDEQYTRLNDRMTAIGLQVNKAEMKLSSIDIVTHNILEAESNFESELSRLNVLYNTLAVRANALGKWMSDEKLIRDNLQELYRQMTSKTVDEDDRLRVIQADVTKALSKLAYVQEETSDILDSVATAQTAMYDWAVNVTVAVNTHTTKLNSVRIPII
jgi:archaellum component FlaC